MKLINQEIIEILLGNAIKPIATANFPYPINSLDDRIFEILTYSIFKRRIETNDLEIKKKYDDVILMQGVGEKGMDCILKKSNKIVAVIQCKKYATNLSDKLILNELVKFSIYYYLNKSRFEQSKKFKYFIATSTGYTGNAIHLIELLSDKSFVDQYDYEKLVKSILNKYKDFNNVSFEDLKDEIPKLLSNFDYELIRPNDFNIWINNYPEIIDTFFEIKKVTDNSLLNKKAKEIIKKIDKINVDKNYTNIKTFIGKYKSNTIEKLNIVNFIGFDLHKYRQKPTDITLTDLFIRPSFREKFTDKGKKNTLLDKDLKIATVFNSEKNIIILGDPGGGKSLLVKYLIVQILSGNSELIGLKQYKNHIPFRIELRKFNEVRETKSVIDYLFEIINKEYQIEVSKDILIKLFTINETLIFFDGLDEIFNVAHKNKMKECIELFSVTYPNTKCIVTSRFIGYHDIKFSSKIFSEFAIERFNQKQIEELVTKFYDTQIINIERRKNLIANCLSQIEKDVDLDLKSNPLILTLILILTTNNIVIPDSKLEIYEACTKTLVDSIDIKVKELRFELPVRNKRLVFAHLAYWQYESLSKNYQISFDKALRVISDLLIEKNEANEITDAEEKAKRFLEYAEKRSIYFEDNFTHKTFLEYYTADYLYINYFTKASDSARKKVISIITTYLPKAFWYIVFELLFSRIDKEQADTELLDEIFSKQLESNSINVFYFLVSNTMKLVNVSDALKKEILIKTIKLFIKGEKVTGLRFNDQFRENSLLSKLNYLQKEKIFHGMIEEVFNEIEQNPSNEKELIELYILLYEMSSINNENPINISNPNKRKELAYKDLHLFTYTIVQGRKKSTILDIEKLITQIEYFGIKSIFKDLNYKYRENAIRVCIFNIYLKSIIENLEFNSFSKDYNQLMKMGIKHEQILDHIKTTRIYFFNRGEGFEKTLQLYIKSKDKQLDEIILIIIKNMGQMRYNYEKFRSENYDIKLKNVDILFGLK